MKRSNYQQNFCNQPFFALYIPVQEISLGFSSQRGNRARPPSFFTRASHLIWGKHQAKGWVCSKLSPFHSLSLFISLISLPLYISPSTFLSLSLLLSLLSIILFGVSNGRFRPCFLVFKANLYKSVGLP